MDKGAFDWSMLSDLDEASMGESGAFSPCVGASTESGTMLDAGMSLIDSYSFGDSATLSPKAQNEQVLPGAEQAAALAAVEQSANLLEIRPATLTQEREEASLGTTLVDESPVRVRPTEAAQDGSRSKATLPSWAISRLKLADCNVRTFSNSDEDESLDVETDEATWLDSAQPADKPTKLMGMHSSNQKVTCQEYGGTADHTTNPSNQSFSPRENNPSSHDVTSCCSYSGSNPEDMVSIFSPSGYQAAGQQELSSDSDEAKRSAAAAVDAVQQERCLSSSPTQGNDIYQKKPLPSMCPAIDERTEKLDSSHRASNDHKRVYEERAHQHSIATSSTGERERPEITLATPAADLASADLVHLPHTLSLEHELTLLAITMWACEAH